jgi:hypothetical protein
MADNIHDFQLRYVGDRFDGARLPVDVLGDLPAFRDLLVAFVKENWRSRYTSKTRLPKGFDKSLSFDLVKITDGSAVPNLNWNRSLAQTYLPGFVDQLDAVMSSSFEQFVNLIDSADDDNFSQALSQQQVRALNKLGSGLRDDERIEFLDTRGSNGKVIYLDNYRRKKLITRVRETYETRTEGIGRLLQARVEPPPLTRGHIVIATEKFGDVTVSLDAEQIADDFGPYLGSEIQYDLQVEVDNNDLVRSVIEVHDLDVIDEEHSAELLRCRERLRVLSELRSGWSDGDGVPISQKALENASRLLAKRASMCNLFKVFPNEEGGVLIEFETAGWDFTIEFAPGGKVEMYGIEIDGDDSLDPIEYGSIDQTFLMDFDRRVLANG